MAGFLGYAVLHSLRADEGGPVRGFRTLLTDPPGRTSRRAPVLRDRPSGEREDGLLSR